MTNKTKLIYWMCVATIGFGSASTKASDSPNNNHCPQDKHDAFVNCYTTWDFTSKENSVKGFKQCLEQHGINDSEAKECHKEMFNNIKKSVRESVNKSKKESAENK